MFGLILDLKNNLEAVIGIVASLAVVWRFVGRPLWTRVKRIDQAIGINGGSSLFEQMDKIKDMLYVHASIVDVIDRPILFILPDGEVDTINVAFSEQTGWSIERLKRGGWRQLFSHHDQDDWDESVSRRSVFMRDITIRQNSFSLVAKPVFNDERFLGWRAVLTPKNPPRRRMSDQP